MVKSESQRRIVESKSIALCLLLRITVVLLLGFVLLLQAEAESVDEADLLRIVTGYYYAIGENRLEDAMSFYHSGSPRAVATRAEILLGQSAFLQRTSTFSFKVVYQDGARVVALATHRHLRIAGVKFLEQFVKVAYIFRQQDSRWKLWMAWTL